MSASGDARPRDAVTLQYMTPRLYLELLLLGAIWGGSFIFMRVLAPNIGALVTAELRLALGGLGLCLWFAVTSFDAQWRLYWKRFLLLGLLNTATPFALFGYAALTLPGSYSAIINSMSPLWGALFASVFLGDPLTRRKIAGLLLGVTGVALITRAGPVPVNTATLLATAACIAATICYGLAGIFIKRYLADAKPMAIAAGSQLLPAVVLLPSLLTVPATAQWSGPVLLNVSVVGLLCGSFAFLLYYRLVALAGPVKALSVTFLIPMFGMVWGHVFLDEVVTPGMLGGCVVVLAGLAMLSGKAPAPAARQP